MNTPAMTFTGFIYDAELCSKYHYAAGIFTISLKDGNIIHHMPDNTEAFREWLLANRIRDIETEFKKS